VVDKPARDGGHVPPSIDPLMEPRKPLDEMLAVSRPMRWIDGAEPSRLHDQESPVKVKYVAEPFKLLPSQIDHGVARPVLEGEASRSKQLRQIANASISLESIARMALRDSPASAKSSRRVGVRNVRVCLTSRPEDADVRRLARPSASHRLRERKNCGYNGACSFAKVGKAKFDHAWESGRILSRHRIGKLLNCGTKVQPRWRPALVVLVNYFYIFQRFKLLIGEMKHFPRCRAIN
jgi:hypothetical protein